MTTKTYKHGNYTIKDSNKVLAAVAACKGAPLDYEAIATALGVSRATVQQNISRLCAVGLLYRVSKKVFEVNSRAPRPAAEPEDPPQKIAAPETYRPSSFIAPLSKERLMRGRA